MTILALIPCTKTKAIHRCAAPDMYWPSPLFRWTWRAAAAGGQRPLILSAKYGLLTPDQEIDPYDETVAGWPREKRETWALKLWPRLTTFLPAGANTGVVSYLSARYGEFLMPWLRSHGVQVDEPLKGMRNGQRLAWLKQAAGP